MLYVNKINFSSSKIRQIIKNLDGYIWIAVDVKRGIIAAGDERVEALKTALLTAKSSILDIFGVGLNLDDGKIDFISKINIKYLDKSSTKNVPVDKQCRIETLIRYFFTELPAYQSIGRTRFYKFSKL